LEPNFIEDFSDDASGRESLRGTPVSIGLSIFIGLRLFRLCPDFSARSVYFFDFTGVLGLRGSLNDFLKGIEMWLQSFLVLGALSFETD